MGSHAICIALQDTSPGYAVCAERVPLAVLSTFAKEVEQFLRGDTDGLDTTALEVALRPGELAIQTTPFIQPVLVHDLHRMALSPVLDGVSARRRTVVLRWQARAHRSRLYRVEIRSGYLEQPIVINADSQFRADDADAWVNVERYVRGQLEELGGSTVVNAHLRLFDGSSLTVATDKARLASEPRNRLYKTVLLRIRARFNLYTGQYRDAELMEFVDHDRRLDAREWDALIQRGSRLWHGLPPITTWLDVQRGAAG